MREVMRTEEAARRLRISPQRVRVLWHEGALSGQMVGDRLLLDRASVLDLGERDRPPSRPLSARNAWTLLLMLAGESSPWASAPERSRLRRLLASREHAALALLVRSRARAVRLAGIDEAGGYLRRSPGIVPAGAMIAHRWTDLVAEGVTEVYAAEARTRALIDRLQLWPDPNGPIVVHAVPDTLADVLQGRAEMPESVAAVDLLESGDPRSRRAGEALWAGIVRARCEVLSA